MTKNAVLYLQREPVHNLENLSVQSKGHIFIDLKYCQNMDIRIKVRYSLICLFAILFFIPPIPPVSVILKGFAAFALFYFLPGVFLARKFFTRCYLISSVVLAVLVGMCFHIVYIYFLSLFEISFNIYFLLIPAIIFAVLADYFKVQLPRYNHKEVYLVLAGITFFLLTYNLAPGEDANGHLLVVNMILEDNVIPKTYTLYPEISLSYHMGFNIIDSELEYITGILLLPVTGALFGVFIIFSTYLCVKSFHTEKAGLISGVLVAFGVLPPLYYLSYGAYASMISFTLQPLIIFLLYSKISDAEKTAGSDILFFSFIFAAGFMSHSSFILFWIPLLLFSKKYKPLVGSLLSSMLLSVPHLLRLQPGYSPQEVVQLYHLWYIHEVFRIQMFAERIGVLIFVCGILGLLFLKRRELLFFSVWLSSLLVLAVLSLFGMEFPLWFAFLANRLIDLMFLPLVLLASIFISEIGKNKSYMLVILLVLPMAPHFYNIPQSTTAPLFPTDSLEFAADQEGIIWLRENTDESAVILTDWWTGTGSSWVTSLGDRQLLFPFLYVHDHFLEILHVPERGRDVLCIGLAPDTEQSYNLLSEWGVDYIFLSSYVEDRVKWRRDCWNVQELIESPNFELFFNKEETYIFKVRKEGWVYTNIFSLGNIKVEKDKLSIPPLKESYPVKKFIKISYVDSSTDIIEFWSDHGLAAKIPLLNTGKIITVALPFRPFLQIESSEPVQITTCEVVTTISGHTLDSIALSPDWILNDNEYITLNRNGHIYLSGTKTFKIVYKDSFTGRIDINILLNGTLKPLTSIDRKGDNQIKEITINLSEPYHFADIHITVHGPPFSVLSFHLL